MSDFHVTTQETPDATRIIVHGDLTLEAACVLKDKGRNLVAAGCRHILVELAGVEFISSTGIGALLVLQDQFEEVGGRAEFVDLSPEVRSVLRMMDLEKALNVAETDDGETTPRPLVTREK